MTLVSVALAAMPVMLAGQVDSAPTVQVSPARMLAGLYQRVRFTFTNGAAEIGPGGGVRVELPVAYLETGPYYWDRPQTDQPEGRGWVEAETTGAVRVDVELGGRHGGIIEIVVRNGVLKPGESIVLEYAGVVQSLTWGLPVRAQWRSGESDAWRDVERVPTITFLPQKAATLVAVNPADVQLGQPFEMAVVLLDKFGNQASSYRGTVSFASVSAEAELPDPYTFTARDAGVHVFSGVRYAAAGFHKITLSDGRLEGSSNYSEVHNDQPPMRRYFGETHFHTGSGMPDGQFTDSSGGGDHRGHFTTQDAAYRYARDVARLDFASASEHDARGFGQSGWEASRDVADAFYDPERFTTFYAYEWTASATEGHHVIVYSDRRGQLLTHFEYPTQVDLFNALERRDAPALVIPHAMWAQPDHGIWNEVNNSYRRVGEIYSLWNNRFLLQPGDEPQRFEVGVSDRWSYQYAWHRGHRIGVVGSSDNHTGQPGANNYTPDTQHAGGLAVVWAEANTREAIFDALQRRRAYATTGTRILLEFRADGHWMGEEYSTVAPPLLDVKVAGSNRIRSVEIIKYNGTEFRSIRTVKPDTEVCVFQHRDADFTGDSMYYVRVSQVDEHYRSPWSKPTREMAWSSPVWVTHAESARNGN